MFKIGEFVTGKDRSFTRSIYVLMEDLDGTFGIYKPVAYNGREVFTVQARRYTHRQPHAEFKSASRYEVTTAGYTPRVALIDLLYKLGIIVAHRTPFNDNF